MRTRQLAHSPPPLGVDPSLLAELHTLEAAIGGQSILDYMPRVSPVMPGGVPGQAPQHLKAIADLIAMAEYQPMRVCVSVPPRHGKTELILHAIAWWLQRHPEHTIAYCSYSGEIANGKSVRCRDISIASGVPIRADMARAGEWRTLSGGGLLATGVGGPLTSHGCFVAGTQVATPSGSRPIESVATGDYVWGCKNGEVVARRVTATRTLLRNDLVRLTTGSGRVVTCTADHPFYVRGQGYWRADALQLPDGSSLATRGRPGASPQCASKGTGDQTRTVCDGGLPDMSGCAPVAVVELAPRAWQGMGSVLATVPVWQPSSEQQAHPADHMCSVRHPSAEPCATLCAPEADVLLEGVQGAGTADRHLDSVPMRRQDQDGEHKASVLLSLVCQPGPQRAHARPGQLALQGEQQLHQVLRADAEVGTGEGWPQLHGLLLSRVQDQRTATAQRTAPGEDHPPGPPPGRGPIKQPTGQPGDVVRAVPWAAPQVGSDSVFAVDAVGGEGQWVYDLQVEDARSFFVEGLLVHNCNLLIVDDPIKNREEAESATQRQKVMEWFTSTAMTRPTPGGSVIVVHTRWHGDDLIGRLKKAGGWTVINLPAYNEKTDAYLWPEGGWDKKALEPRRKDIGEYDWWALFQGEPRPRGGRMFQEPTFYDKPVLLNGARIMMACDPAATAKTHADYSVIIVGSIYTCPDGMPGIDVLDVHRVQVEIPRLVQTLMYYQQRYRAAVGIEAVGGFKGVPQTLRQQLKGVKIVDIKPVTDKFTRALPTAAAWNGHRIRLPGVLNAQGVLEPDHARHPWINTFLMELEEFTGIADDHDDQVDALAHLYFLAATSGNRKINTVAEIARYFPFG